MSAVKKAKDAILQRHLASAEELKGCSEQEIARIESQFGVPLPSIYREFLLAMGCGAGHFFRGTDMFYPTLLRLRPAAEELLESEEANFTLPSSAFVFMMHQGYQFLYFDTSLREDPPIWMYLEGETDPCLLAQSFSEWLLTSVDEHGGSDDQN